MTECAFASNSLTEESHRRSHAKIYYNLFQIVCNALIFTVLKLVVLIRNDMVVLFENFEI